MTSEKALFERLRSLRQTIDHNTYDQQDDGVVFHALDEALVMFDADGANLKQWTPETGVHSRTFNRYVPEHLVQWCDVNLPIEPRFRAVRESRAPMVLADIPVQEREESGLSEIFDSGFEAGISEPVVGAGDRYLGMLSIGKQTGSFSGTELFAFRAIADEIGKLVDPFAPPESRLAIKHSTQSIWLISAAGRPARISSAGDVGAGEIPPQFFSDAFLAAQSRRDFTLVDRDGFLRLELESVHRGVLLSAVRGETSLPALTLREAEVLALIAVGLTAKDIAAQLLIAVRTVTAHSESLMRKLGVSTRSGLTRRAADAGLLHRECIT